ncbi:hypothetical protein BGZ80_006876 [Entomortierella chlamydospora]|uniref:Uncharacterized protein n=1 Tax=Entomortierella chlamydospora TaxID=101097 RepID=A0A9P6MGD9_9FUNG|nr:hypothetical protein BGZ80_006876 [Entomortierella chlamydospora]
MDLALHTVLPNTHIVNCIWQLYSAPCCDQSPNRLESRLLGRDAFKKFKVDFWLAQKSLTADEFEARWATLRQVALSSNKKAARYLRRVFKHRHQWARFQVGSFFTAGMQSTQRQKGSGNRTPLKELLKDIQERLDEDLTKRYIALEDDTKVDSREYMATALFPGVVDVNNKYLGRFAREAMLEEMCESSKFLVNNIPVDQAIGWHSVNPQTAASNLRLH